MRTQLMMLTLTLALTGCTVTNAQENSVELLPPESIPSPYYENGVEILPPPPPQYYSGGEVKEGDETPLMPMELFNKLEERWNRHMNGPVPYPLEPGEKLPSKFEWYQQQTEFQEWQRSWQPQQKEETWKIRIKPRNGVERIEEVPLNSPKAEPKQDELPIIKPRVKPERKPIQAPRPRPRGPVVYA